ncbi:MAG: hypothetical protein AB1394_13150 [Bacteroidota bacterium]
MKPANLLAILLIALLTTFSCKESITEPEPPAGRRDYVWKADTLKLPSGEFATISEIWGAGPNDIWASGSGSSNEYRLWNYSNGKWNNVEIGFSILEARKLFGFNNSNIWLGTAFGIIARYDGIKWTSFGNLSPSGEILVIQGLWGTSVTDLYAFGFLDKLDRTGYRGCIMKYNGSKWSSLSIDTLSLNFLSMGYDKDTKKYFLHAYQSESGKQFIYELAGNKLTKLFESKEETKVFSVNNKAYFMVGKKIYKYNKNDGLYVWKDFSSFTIYAGIFEGRNEKDIFTINWGGIGHYNGDDIVMLFQTDLWFLDSILFDKDIFVACKNFQTGVNVIVHGKANN